MLIVFATPIPQISAQESGAALEEVTVTARRYEESLQDVPTSVSAMTSDYLEDQDLNDVKSIIEFSPGGAFTAFNKMQQEYSLRGASSQTEGSSGDSSIVTVIDNIAISREFMKSQAFFDMDRVEILRGPQGTSFGRNASSGLIHLITARPEQEFSGRIIADAGDYSSYGVEGYVTGGLAKNLAGRLAVNFDTHDGYTTDIDAGPSDAGIPDSSFGDDLGGEQNYAVRGSLLFNPRDDLEIFVKAEYNRDDDDNPSPRKGLDCTIPYQADFPTPSIVGAPQPGWTQYTNWQDSCDPFETSVSNQTYLGEHSLERDIFNLTAEISWAINDSLTLTSVTGYLKGDSDYLIELHGGPNNSAWQSTQNDAWQFSQELRLDNHASGDRLRWLGGFYYLTDDQTRDDANIFYVDNAVGDPQHPSGFRPEGRDIKQQINETDSYGIFGEVSYDFTDQISATFGGRYSRDKKDYGVAHYGWGWGGPIDGLTNGIDANGDGILDEQCQFGPGGPPDFGLRFCGSPADPVGFETPVRTDSSWDNFSMKGSVSYAFTDDQMVYGLVAQGYKTGGFQNEPFNPSDALIPFDEETVISYELGYKGTFMDRFRLNLSVFRTDYSDLQLFLFETTPTGDYNQVTENAADVEITGVEVEYVLQVNDYFRVSGSYAYLNAELVNALIDTDGDLIPENYNGTRPENSPEWTTTAIVEFTYPFSNGSSMDLRADYRGSGDFYDGIGEPATRRHDSFNIFGLRGTWHSADDKWSASIWSKNLFDKHYTTNVGPDQPNVNQRNFGYAPPRTFGGTVSYRF